MFGLAVANPRGHFWGYKLFCKKQGIPKNKLHQYEWFKNEDALNRDMNKETAKKLDRRHRAHDRTKSGIFVGGGG